MLVRLIDPCNSQQVTQCYVFDVLRELLHYNIRLILGRKWYVSNLVIVPPAAGRIFGTESLFPEYLADKGYLPCIVTGERLMERLGLVHEISNGLLVLLSQDESSIPPEFNREWEYGNVNPTFKGAELEFRLQKGEYLELYTTDQLMLNALQELSLIKEVIA